MAKIDYDDEDAVLEEVARALDEDPDDLRIEEDRGLTGFGEGTVYSVTTRGGRKEWQVVENDDQERALALAVVQQDLEEEPEIFNRDFIERHIDKDKLRSELHSDALDMRIEELSEMSPDDFWREWENEGFEFPEYTMTDDERDEMMDPDDGDVETLAEKQIDAQLRDPMQYLEEIYGDEAAAKALEIAGFAIAAAAEDAVDTDGPAHFLARYDGQSHTTRSGLVYWRSN
jgi:hypothetical protein